MIKKSEDLHQYVKEKCGLELHAAIELLIKMIYVLVFIYFIE